MVIDSHLHLDQVWHHHPHRIAWLKNHTAAVVSWAWATQVDSVAELGLYLDRQRQIVGRLRDQGLNAWFLTGIHPRNITDDLDPEQIGSLLAPHLGDPACLGLGEIGLETGSSREQAILRAQLAIGKSLAGAGKRLGIHTPRDDKVRVTELLLDLLGDFGHLASSSVIDHCTAATLKPVLAAGFWAGITLGPGKTVWRELPQVVAGIEDFFHRIMLNTDSATAFYEDLVAAAGDPALVNLSARGLFGANAARFFNIRSDDRM